MFSVIPALCSFTIPYSPFDFEKLSPYFQDFFAKISQGAFIGFAVFLSIGGVYLLIKLINGLGR